MATNSLPILQRRRRLRESAMRHVLIALALVIMIYPLLWMVRLSLMPDSEIGTAGLVPEGSLTFRNYSEGWNALSIPFSRFFINSAVIAVLSIAGNLLACSLTAYVLARIAFRMRRIYFGIVVMTLLIPFHVLLIPQYLIFSNLSLLDSYVPLVLPKFLATDAFFVFLMIQFIRGIPRELDEAAFIDGAGHLRIFWSVILPLMRPALATTAIFTLIWTWNDFLGPLVYLTSTQWYTVPVALNSLMSADSGLGIGRLLAMSVLAIAPLIAFFIAAQRHIVEGVATTGLK